ncbi:hypothetical protein DT019_03265 [Streptomyces sp. SDr-06]|nr:hypothetical protein DT019_03265 [Streptomyces sp. SDr-06]
MTAERYHADPVPGGSLSSTGARRLLAPSCPALFRHHLDHGQPPKREFDLGTAAHAVVLNDGPVIEVIDADNYTTKSARAQRDAARAEGLVPLLAAEHEQVQAMADALRNHTVAGQLFAPGTGIAEQSLFWQDRPTGVWRRARPDWLPVPAGRRIVVDYKTARDVSPDAIQKAVYEHGYHQQAAWYLDGIKALGMAGDSEPAFVFVFQAKAAPYLVTVVELDSIALAIGAARNRRAIQLYAECTATGHWPAYDDGIAYLPLPAWAEIRDKEEYL